MNFKRLGKFLKDPPFLLLCITATVAVGGIVGTALLLPSEGASKAWGYVFLSIMCIFAAYTAFGAIRTFPVLNDRIMAWSEGKPFWERLFREYGFRAIFFAFASFLLNLAFAAYNSAVAILNDSVWFGALASYYILLIVLRGIILGYHTIRRKAVKAGQAKEMTELKDTRIYSICGVVLLLLPIALSTAILQMVRANESFVHTGLTIYVYALYAFVKIGMAIYNFVKTRHSGEMTVRAAKNINLADAMVSILALQTAMLYEFDTTGSGINIAKMNALTGAAVCALTVALGISMIVIACKKIKSRKKTLSD